MNPIRRSWLMALASVVVVTAASTGCDVLYTFDRELPVARGAIFGEAVRDEAGGAGAAYSQVNMMGVGLVRQATSEGVFALTDLNAGTYILRINDDDDGDGQPDRSRLIATSLVVADRPDALGPGGSSQLVSTSLGEVIIEGTGAVSGEVTVDDGNGVQVPPADIGLGGRALIFRDVVTELTGEQALQLGADAETHVDAEGRYRFNKALSGEFLLVVALHQGAGAERNETVYVSEPQRLTLGINESVVATIVTVDAIDANLEDDVRTVEVLVTPTLSDRGAPYAIFGPPGRTLSTCQDTRPAAAQFVYERIVDATASDISRLDGAPLGVWDVRLCGEAQFVDPETGNLEDDVTLGSATLFSLVIPPSEDGLATVLTGPVVLNRELDPCIRRVCTDGAAECAADAKGFIRDCDGDGIAGIAPYDPTDQVVVNTWSTCAVQCGANTGLAAVESECAFDGVVYDCDDDGDLQTDASEPPACYGPGLGDDRDGDGLCSGEDGFPTCAANTAAACEAGTVDVNPVVPEEFSGGEVQGVFDPAFQNGLFESLVTTNVEFKVLAGFVQGTAANLVMSRRTAGGEFVEGAVFVDAVDENGNTVGPRFQALGNQLYIEHARTNPTTLTTALTGVRGIEAAAVPVVCRLTSELLEDNGFAPDGCADAPSGLDVTLPATGWSAISNAAEIGDVFVAAEAVDDATGDHSAIVLQFNDAGELVRPALQVLLEGPDFAPGDAPVVTGLAFIPAGVGPERVMVIGNVPGGDGARAFYALINLEDGAAVVAFFPVDDANVVGAFEVSADFIAPDDTGSLLIGGTISTVETTLLTLRRIDPQTAEFFVLRDQTRALATFGGGPAGAQSINDVKVSGEEVLVVGAIADVSTSVGFLRRFAAGNFDIGTAFDGTDVRFTENNSTFDQLLVGPQNTHVTGGQFSAADAVGYWAARLP